MTESTVLDVLLLVLLVGYVAYGVRAGLSHAVFAFAGVVAGAIAAFFLVPLVSAWVPFPQARPLVVIFTVLGLIALGTTLGALIGRTVRRGFEATPLSGLDRVAGGIATGVAAALIASVLSTSVGQLGVPMLSRAIAGSAVLRTISTLTPDPVEAYLAELRSTVIDSGLPVISGALGIQDAVIPTIDAGSPELTAAAQSVVRITGNALACGVAQSGSGFVVADDRIITNAHVVAGVTEPVIETPGGQAIASTVVYFDPIDDITVLAAPGLDPEPLALGQTAAPGADAAIQGYPFGGPFSIAGAEVITSGPLQLVTDGSTTISRDAYTLAADVEPGNSGGPLLTVDGQVAGVVFARASSVANVGYALTMNELSPVAAQAPTLSAPVDTGSCAG